VISYHLFFEGCWHAFFFLKKKNSFPLLEENKVTGKMFAINEY
jgi:hypothetical protein